MAEFINLGQRQLNAAAIRTVTFEADGSVSIQYLGGVGGEVLIGPEAEAFKKFMAPPAAPTPAGKKHA